MNREFHDYQQRLIRFCDGFESMRLKGCGELSFVLFALGQTIWSPSFSDPPPEAERIEVGRQLTSQLNAWLNRGPQASPILQKFIGPLGELESILTEMKTSLTPAFFGSLLFREVGPRGGAPRNSALSLAIILLAEHFRESCGKPNLPLVSEILLAAGEFQESKDPTFALTHRYKRLGREARADGIELGEIYEFYKRRYHRLGGKEALLGGRAVYVRPSGLSKDERLLQAAEPSRPYKAKRGG